MDLHIYDMKLDPQSVVIMTGNIGQNEIQSFSGYLRVIQNIFPNPVIYIPSDSTLDMLPEEDVIALLKDCMNIQSLERLNLVAQKALEQKCKEIAEEGTSHESSN